MGGIIKQNQYIQDLVVRLTSIIKPNMLDQVSHGTSLWAVSLLRWTCVHMRMEHDVRQVFSGALMSISSQV